MTQKTKQSDYVVEPWSAEGLEINVNDSLTLSGPGGGGAESAPPKVFPP